MKAERAVILEKDKERLMEQQQMFRENEARLKEQSDKLATQITEQDTLIVELKENQGNVLSERRQEQDIDDQDGLGEGKYYKGICKKMVMDIYKLKAAQTATRFDDLALSQNFQ